MSTTVCALSGIPFPRSPLVTKRRAGRRRAELRHFARFSTTFRPDVVHVHSLVTGLGLHEMQAARDAGARVVYTNHLPSMGFACPRGTLMRWGTTVCDGYQPVQTCAACTLQARGLPQRAAEAVATLPPPLTRAISRLPGRWATALGMTAIVADGRMRQHSLTALADRIVVLNDIARQIFVMHGANPQPSGRESTGRQRARAHPQTGARHQADDAADPCRVCRPARSGQRRS